MSGGPICVRPTRPVLIHAKNEQPLASLAAHPDQERFENESRHVNASTRSEFHRNRFDKVHDWCKHNSDIG